MLGPMKRVRVNGVELAYREVGEVGSGDRPFVLVHGFTGSGLDFEEQLPQLAAERRVVALDQRGHGDSTNTGDPSSYTFEQLNLDLEAFLDALGIERCDLLGHSMGGIVALRFVLAHPERVASLVLMDTAASASEGMSRRMLEGAAGLARSQGMEKLLEGMRSTSAVTQQPAAAAFEARIGSERFWERIRTKIFAMDPEAFAALGAELLDQESLVPRLGEIDCPTLVLVGEQDANLLPAADVLEKEIRGARRATIPNAAHSPQHENAERWLETQAG